MSNPIESITPEAKRTIFCDSLRDVADFYEQHPGFPIPAKVDGFLAYVGSYGGVEVPTRFAELASMLGGCRTKDSDDNWFRVFRYFGPFTVEVYAEREAVCERIVVGTEKVEVPDPDAPKVTVEREVVHWRCVDSVLGATS